MRDVKLHYGPTPVFDAWLAENGPYDVSKWVEELSLGERDSQPERVHDLYTHTEEVKLWGEAKRHSELGRRWLGLGPFRYRVGLSFFLQKKITSKILRADPSCKTVVNFGALYAKPDSDLARKFPGVQFYGVDRSATIKAMNEQAFPGQPNLHFVASDMLSFLQNHDVRGGLFVHSITAFCIMPKMLEAIYAQCAASGIKHMHIIEFSGYSHQLQRFYQFEDERKPSVVHRHAFFIHDYPNMMRDAGYELAYGRLFKAPMPKPFQNDNHLITLHAIAAPVL